MNLIRRNLQYLRTCVRVVANPIYTIVSESPGRYLLSWGMYRSDIINVFRSYAMIGTAEDSMPDNIPHAWRDDL